MTRLRWKLLLAMLAVIGVTVAMSGLFTRRLTHQEIRRVALTPRRPDIRQLLELRARGGWSGAEQVLDRMAGRFVLTNPRREVLATSSNLRGATVRVDGNDRVSVRRGTSEMVVRMPPIAAADALLYVLPAEEPAERIAAFDRRLVAMFGVATLTAVLLTLLLSRRITGPVERLTAAAEEMARGRRPERLPIRGSDEIAQLGRSFNAMADALAEQEQLRRRMVSDVAHELRTPLTNLRCELEAIEDGLVRADRTHIASLREEVLHLSRLVDDLQELAVAEAGGVQLERSRIELGATVAGVVESFAASRPVAVSVEEVWVEADPVRVGQILRNLLGNAFRHARERVAVSVSRRDGDALVAVTDDGPGIPDEDLPHVFERFYRADEARSRSGGGAGLGLAIVKQLVELHGGRVEASNRPEGGAIVSFTIPS